MERKDHTVMHPSIHMPLSAVSTGRTAVLRRIRGGHDLAARLAAMGFVPGVTIVVHQNDRNGPVVVAVKGGRVMLGRGMAAKMAVE